MAASKRRRARRNASNVVTAQERAEIRSLDPRTALERALDAAVLRRLTPQEECATMSAMDQAIAEGKRVSHEVWTAASPEQQAALRAKLGIEVKDGKPQRRTDSKRQAAPKAQRNTAKASPKATGDPRVAAAIVALEAVVKVLKSI